MANIELKDFKARQPPAETYTLLGLLTASSTPAEPADYKLKRPPRYLVVLRQLTTFLPIHTPLLDLEIEE